LPISPLLPLPEGDRVFVSPSLWESVFLYDQGGQLRSSGLTEGIGGSVLMEASNLYLVESFGSDLEDR